MFSLRRIATLFAVLGSLALPLSAAADEPVVTADPPSYDFGTWNSANDVIPITHFAISSADVEDLSIESVDVSGPGAEAFSASARDECLPEGHPDAPACEVEVSFDYFGTTGGQKEAVLSVTTNATETPVSIPLSGEVVHTRVSISPESHDFGEVEAGGIGRTKAFTITTSGSMPFSPGEPYIEGDPRFTSARADSFEIVFHDCQQVIDIGSDCSATVAFKPPAGQTGTQHGYLAIGPGMLPRAAALIGTAFIPDKGRPGPPPESSKLDLSLRFAKKPRAGRNTNLVVRMHNPGKVPVRAVKVTARAPRRLVKPLKPVTAPMIKAGESVTRKIRVRLKPKATQGRKLAITAKARSDGETIGHAARTVRVR